MGRALELVTGRVTNPGATITALTPNTGNTFTVRAAREGSSIWLEDLWAFGGTAGVVRIRSPRLHDNAQGIRARYVAATAQPLIPYEARQRLWPQDPLAVEASGGAAEVDLASFLVYYEDLQGTDANLATWGEVKDRIVNLVTVERAITTGATVGDYGGAGALNANFDLLKRESHYAVLGYLVDVGCGAVRIQGPDTGNFGVGGPGITRSDITSDWFVELAERLGQPCIPIINAANVAGTTTDIAHSAAGTAINQTWILGEIPA